MKPHAGNLNQGIAARGGLGSLVSESIRVPGHKAADLSGVRRGSGSPVGLVSAMFRRLGIRFFQLRASTLVAVSGDGSSRHLGQCRAADGEQLVFDAWVAHFGVAFDVKLRAATEIATKLDWCRDRGVIYFATDDENDLSEVEQVIRERMLAIRAAKEEAKCLDTP